MNVSCLIATQKKPLQRPIFTYNLQKFMKNIFEIRKLIDKNTKITKIYRKKLTKMHKI